MEPVKRRKQRFFLVLGLILLLIVTGLGMVYRVFDRYGDILLASEDDQLFRLARSVDRSVESYLNRYGTNLIYVTERRGFHTAEETWRTTGDTAELLYRMEENVLAQDDLIQAVLAIQDGVVILSTGGRTDYRFPPRAGREGTVSIRPCMDGDGGIYLAFLREREEGLGYAALMDLEGFYQRVAGDLTVGTQDRIMLLDAGGQTLLHRTMDGVRVDLVDDLKAGDCDFSGLTYLMEHQEQAREGAAFYETNYCRSGETYIARIAVLPATEETNGFFAVGVSVNYDGVIGPLHLAAVRLLAYGGMVVTGIVLLAVLSIRAGRRDERSLRELAVLRKKNQAMEELNRQTRELAHHQRLETIGTLTSSIAHEFNNLLTPSWATAFWRWKSCRRRTRSSTTACWRFTMPPARPRPSSPACLTCPGRTRPSASSMSLPTSWSAGCWRWPLRPSRRGWRWSWGWTAATCGSTAMRPSSPSSC